MCGDSRDSYDQRREWEFFTMSSLVEVAGAAVGAHYKSRGLSASQRFNNTDKHVLYKYLLGATEF
eukprot:scaffold8816_cov36-Prasinocladus_malaysianus.AAC.1